MFFKSKQSLHLDASSGFSLGRRVGVGAQGSVYEDSSRPNIVIKVIHLPSEPKKRDEILNKHKRYAAIVQGQEAHQTGLIDLLAEEINETQLITVHPRAALTLSAVFPLIKEILHSSDTLKKHIGISFLIDFLQTQAKALHHLTHHRTCHADIKPDNIVLLSDEHAQNKINMPLIDFGSMTNWKENEAHGELSDFIGTIPYVAPEAFCFYRYSTLSDLWCVGNILSSFVFHYYPLPNYPLGFKNWCSGQTYLFQKPDCVAQPHLILGGEALDTQCKTTQAYLLEVGLLEKIKTLKPNDADALLYLLKQLSIAMTTKEPELRLSLSAFTQCIKLISERWVRPGPESYSIEALVTLTKEREQEEKFNTSLNSTSTERARNQSFSSQSPEPLPIYSC